MFTLLNPAALLALLGLLVPVAIHLWNRRPGREVAVGSLRWLATGANRRLRNLKLEQLWLLLLRAALLAVLAVAVAGPVWQQRQPASRGVVLISAEVTGLPALSGLKPTIDSLRRKGYALRWLAAGFPRISGPAWRAVAGQRASGTADSVAAGPPERFAWARAQQAGEVFAGQPLVVVTSTALRRLQGSHSPLPAAVRWLALPDSTTVTWLGAAEQVGDSLQLLVGRSNEMQTTYRREKVLMRHDGQPLRVPGLAPLRLQTAQKAGEPETLAPTNNIQDTSSKIEIKTAPTVIDIYASPEFAADARSLEAGLRAAAVGLPMPPQLRRVKARPEHLTANWTFWLSDEPLPSGWRQDLAGHARHLWREAAAPGVADTTRLAPADAAAAAISVFRRAGSPAPEGSATVWADGRGRPVLSRQLLGRGTVYQLHTRLSPAWSELADDPQFPARLLNLLLPESSYNSGSRQARLAAIEATHDRRAIAPAQLPTGPDRAAHPATTATRPAQAFRTTDLRPWLVMLAGLLLLLERLLARRRAALILPAAG